MGSKADKPITITLTIQERDLLLNQVLLLPDEIEIRLNNAVSKNNMYIIDVSTDELEDLLGFIAAEANRSTTKKLADELDLFYEKLESAEEVIS